MRDRPYLNFGSFELIDLFDTNKNVPEIVKDVAYEIAFRTYMPKEERARVIEQLILFLENQQSTKKDKPGFDFPVIHLHDTRSRCRKELGNPNWREVGLLKISGYTVGKTDGKPFKERRKIMNFIFLKDDLSDIEDVIYAKEWGQPKSEERLKKLANSIASFANNAIKNPADMSIAISDWVYDLNYLKVTFYDGWHNFPWPEIELEIQ